MQSEPNYNKFLNWNFNHTYHKVYPKLYANALPNLAPKPYLTVFNEKLATDLGLIFTNLSLEQISAELSGSVLHPEALPIALAYAGHQFGHFTMLGDGRAILLGEHISPNGKRWDIQFKGSGQTQYSRRGDGKASLKAMLREYLISEAMYGLGISTTRSLGVVKTGEEIYREIPMEGAVLTRVAASHIRVGTFEYASRFLSKEVLKSLTEYTVERHFPELKVKQNIALALLEKVMDVQIALIVDWLRVGFIHGVMNTDNMSIAGETIDYGPCAFMNAYNPNTVYSSIDHQGRYAFGNQAPIAHWNLVCLANALLPIIDENINLAAEMAQVIIDQFKAKFSYAWNKTLLKKMGIVEIEENDHQMSDELLNWMIKNKADYTNTFAFLTYPNLISDSIYAHNQEFLVWYNKWQNRLEKEKSKFVNPTQVMKASNPILIPRNHIVEEVLEQMVDYKNKLPWDSFLNVLSHPYELKNIDSYYLQVPSNNQDLSYQTFCGT